MENNQLLAIEKRVVARFLDMFIKFGLILALGSFCLTVLRPILNMMLWAMILAVTLYPLHQRLSRRLGGKPGRASLILVLLGLLLIVSPTVLMVISLGESASAMVAHFSGSHVVVPAPSEKIAAIPLIGKKVYVVWMKASTDLPGLISTYHAQLIEGVKVTLSLLASMGGGLVAFVFSFIVSGVMMAYGAAGAASASRIFIRLTDNEKGPVLSKLCTGTIRAVAQGVIGVAFIQALLAGVLIGLAGIPAAGIFFVLALILGIAQLPVVLVTGPAVALMWMTGDHGTVMNVIFTVLLVVAGMVDNVLKPIMLGRGVDAPMPVILMGALGGMAVSGILGMFIGATLLSIGYLIFMTWVNNGLAAAEAESQ